jgi:MerR family redox-sensitive transcriptional activator SoxR
MSAWSIGEVARRARVRPSALRYYERVGLLTPPAREHGQRRYDPSVFPALALIAAAKRAGFTIAEMRRLLVGFGPEVPAAARWRLLAEEKDRELVVAIREARRKRTLLKKALQCRCRDLEECGTLIAIATRSR